jgi:hypothetical protein
MMALNDLYKKLVIKSLERCSEFVSELNETNKFSFGKIMVKITSLQNFFCTNTFFIRVSTGPYKVETRQIKFDEKKYTKKLQELKQQNVDPSSLFNYYIN